MNDIEDKIGQVWTDLICADNAEGLRAALAKLEGPSVAPDLEGGAS